MSTCIQAQLDLNSKALLIKVPANLENKDESQSGEELKKW